MNDSTSTPRGSEHEAQSPHGLERDASADAVQSASGLRDDESSSPPYRGGSAVVDSPVGDAFIPPISAAVSRWAIHRRMYDWVLSFAHRKHSTTALAAISFSESSFFPIPPDVLLMPLCLGNRGRSLWFATVCTVASVLGAMLGYLIGWGAWDAVDQLMFDYVPGFSADKFARVEGWYTEWGILVLFAAAFTPIPFKVFTIAGGVFAQPLLPFMIVSFIGRGLRFYLVAGVVWWVGPRALPLIDKYFNLLCIVFMLLLIGGFAVIKLMH